MRDDKIKIKKPFIKKFKDDGDFYLFDVNTNQVIEVEQPVYDLIDSFNGKDVAPDVSALHSVYSKQEIKHYMEQIKQAHDNDGLFSGYRPSLVTMGILEAEDVRKLHRDHGLNQLILELTRECNLNCGYCSTSGKYYSRPKDAVIHMDWRRCKAVLDFFCQRAGGSRRPVISFYGGEPLLRFDLIKQAVSHVKKHYKEKNFQFSMTTNGTLLDKEKIRYLIDNDFTVSVSLDGPEPVNDRYRLFKDGSGAFTTIMKNLASIKETDPEYFSSHEALKEIKRSIRSSPVSTGDTTFIEDYGLEAEGARFPEVAKKLTARLKSAILKKDLSRITIEKMRVFAALTNLAHRAIKKLDEYSYPIGACHIGLRRVFVDISGDFYVCERDNGNYKIGNLETGFDYDRIADFYVKFEAVFQECKDCWAQNYCERCWVVVGNLDTFTGEEKEKFCNMNKTIIENAFKLYVQLLKENPDCMVVFRNDNDTISS
jgi:uncharacterized protein